MKRRDGTGSARDELEAMQDLLHHLPFHQRDALFCDERVAATCTRLDVLPAGAPASEGGVHVWLDGELLVPGGPAGGEGGAAFLLGAYRRDPELPVLADLDGAFAAVVYDAARGRLLLLNDRHGLRHLYWMRDGERLVWSSEVKGFLAVPGFAPAIDPRSVADFFSVGHLLEQRTWLRGVELLPPASVFAWDLAGGRLERGRYWGWERIPEPGDAFDERAAREELAALLREAVATRAAEGERVGVSLSGGLDSRLLLAALPPRAGPVHAVSFGRRGCLDLRIAERVARRRGARHHVVEIDGRNWLDKRLAGVWYSDGQKDLLHMHALAAVDAQREFCPINLNGYLGDAVLGGGYLGHPRWTVPELIDQRGRRFIAEGTRLTSNFHHDRLPFFDHRVLEATLAIPEDRRRGSRFYEALLLEQFPELFRDIPWHHTRLRLGAPRLLVRASAARVRMEALLHWYLGRAGIAFTSAWHLADYGRWIRQPPARELFAELLLDPNARYRQFREQEPVRELWRRHLAGQDLSEPLGRHLTFELWLRQLYDGSHRGGL